MSRNYYRGARFRFADSSSVFEGISPTRTMMSRQHEVTRDYKRRFRRASLRWTIKFRFLLHRGQIPSVTRFSLAQQSYATGISAKHMFGEISPYVGGKYFRLARKFPWRHPVCAMGYHPESDARAFIVSMIRCHRGSRSFYKVQGSNRTARTLSSKFDAHARGIGKIPDFFDKVRTSGKN